MRAIFALLLLLNIGALMWGAWYRDSERSSHVAPRPDIHPNDMRLLNEPGVKLEPRTESEATPLVRTEEVASCYRVGPLPTNEAVTKATKQLDAIGFKHEERKVEQRQEAGQRIYLAGFSDYKTAEAKRAELSRLGIKDHALLNGPDKKILIALGLFTQPNLAERRVRELKKKGVQAQIETVYRTTVQRWLELGALNANGLERTKQALAWMPAIEFVSLPCASSTATHPPGH